MESLNSRNSYRSPILKNDNEVIHSGNKEFDGIESRYDIRESHIYEPTYAQTILPISSNSNEKYRRKERISTTTNQKPSTPFSLEKIWISVICLIAISTLVAFAFLVAITLARQKVATYELQRGPNHLTENFNLCQTEQCGSQFSVNSHRFSNIDNAYSPTKFQTLEKQDHKIHNNSCSNHDANLYSPFVKYDTNTNSTTGSVHQLGFCTKEMTSINTDIQVINHDHFRFNNS